MRIRDPDTTVAFLSAKDVLVVARYRDVAALDLWRTAWDELRERTDWIQDLRPAVRLAAVLIRLSLGVLLLGAALAWYGLSMARPWENPPSFLSAGLLGAAFFVLWASLPYVAFGLFGWLVVRGQRSVAGAFVFLVFSVLLVAFGLLAYSSGVLHPAAFAVPVLLLAVAAAASPVVAGAYAVATRPRTSLLILACGVAALVAGVLLPTLLIGNGTEKYSGDERAYAEFVYEYGLSLIEYPQEPTVALRVTEVGEATNLKGLANGEECAPGVTKRLSAEVVSYGPFGVPVGKTLYRCDLATTVPYPAGAQLGGPLSQTFFFAWAFALLLALLAAPVVLGALLVGGARLWRLGSERSDRAVGLAAFSEGLILLTCSVAYYVYHTVYLFGWRGLWPFT